MTKNWICIKMFRKKYCPLTVIATGVTAYFIVVLYWVLSFSDTFETLKAATAMLDDLPEMKELLKNVKENDMAGGLDKDSVREMLKAGSVTERLGNSGVLHDVGQKNHVEDFDEGEAKPFQQAILRGTNYRESVKKQSNAEGAGSGKENPKEGYNFSVDLDPRSLSVCVVEEHHEVIPYWFKAAELGILPKRGNVLLHIDGHSDIAVPSQLPSSMLKFPSKDQLPQLMQTNDVFIVSAAITGLLSRYIWVVPPWERNTSTVLSRFNGRFVMTLNAGVTFKQTDSDMAMDLMPLQNIGSALAVFTGSTSLEEALKKKGWQNRKKGIPLPDDPANATLASYTKNKRAVARAFSRASSRSLLANNLPLSDDNLETPEPNPVKVNLSRQTAKQASPFERPRTLRKAKRRSSKKPKISVESEKQNSRSVDGSKFNLSFRPNICFCLAGREPSICFPVSITKRNCVKLSSFRLEFVTEKAALELMMNGDNGRPWLDDKHSVILDIDEDYYGCEAAVTPLLQAGLSERAAFTISWEVSKLFCPSTTQQESNADAFFRQFVYKVIQRLQHCGMNKVCFASLQKSLASEVVKTSMEDLQRTGLKSIVCTPETQADILLSLAQRFVSMTQEQLRALARVGICLSHAVKSYKFRPEQGMVLCKGYNTPGATVVDFHTPDPQEVEFRTKQLASLLQNGKAHVTPKLVTLARSVRDGYTPRSLFTKIEEDVLTTLKNSYKNSNVKVVYDPDLLGGRSGWPDRR